MKIFQISYYNFLRKRAEKYPALEKFFLIWMYVISMVIVVVAIILLVIGVVFPSFLQFLLDQKNLWGIWVIKIIGGTATMLFFSYYETITEHEKGWGKALGIFLSIMFGLLLLAFFILSIKPMYQSITNFKTSSLNSNSWIGSITFLFDVSIEFLKKSWLTLLFSYFAFHFLGFFHSIQSTKEKQSNISENEPISKKDNWSIVFQDISLRIINRFK